MMMYWRALGLFFLFIPLSVTCGVLFFFFFLLQIDVGYLTAPRREKCEAKKDVAVVAVVVGSD